MAGLRWAGKMSWQPMQLSNLPINSPKRNRKRWKCTMKSPWNYWHEKNMEKTAHETSVCPWKAAVPSGTVGFSATAACLVGHGRFYNDRLGLLLPCPDGPTNTDLSSQKLLQLYSYLCMVSMAIFRICMHVYVHINIQRERERARCMCIYIYIQRKREKDVCIYIFTEREKDVCIYKYTHIHVNAQYQKNTYYYQFICAYIYI